MKLSGHKRYDTIKNMRDYPLKSMLMISPRAQNIVSYNLKICVKEVFN